MSHVFNFDVPITADDYVHRIGRTGRAGRKGRAITIAAPADGRYVASIEKLIGTEIPRMTLDEDESTELAEDDGGRRRGGRRQIGRPSCRAGVCSVCVDPGVRGSLETKKQTRRH